MSQVFISYAHQDANFVNLLSQDLTEAGISVFYDQMLRPGESWVAVLEEAINRADYILVVLSPNYIASQWAMKELDFGLLREATEEKRRVIPLLLYDCEIPLPLRHITYADFRLDYDHAFKNLLQALHQTPQRPSVGELPGEQEQEVEKSEIQALRQELSEAIELFKSKPMENRQAQAGSPSADLLSEKSKECFIVMPFGDLDLNIVYEDFVKPVIENECGLKCVRADDIFGSNVIMEDILTSIRKATVIIAELTGRNANVFYEVGICHALQKNVLLLAQSIDDVPFDLRHRRVLLYEYTPRGCKRLEQKLKEHLEAMIS